MVNKLFLVAALLLSAAIFSCKKGGNVCQTPDRQLLQGSWKQNYKADDAFSPPPEWEKIEFRNDSFFMRIRVRTDLLQEQDCYQYTWLEYTSGTYHTDGTKVYFNGVYTDSNYAVKTGGCHSTGTYVPVFGISYCNTTLTLKILLEGSTIPEERLRLNFYKQK